jgi:redox-sensitive bicupin YhaK (pirin superfamily)
MIKIRKSQDRGKTQTNWLDSKHTFSFAHYYDPEYTNVGALRVINEDIVKGGTGFDSHPHRNMEIITYILEGSLEHKDSLGTGSIIKPGEVQRMSAGTGIIHSEFNPQPDQPVHLLQIWIVPEKTGLPPSYEQKDFSQKRQVNTLTLLASHDGLDDSLTIHQDASMYVLDLEPDHSFNYEPDPERITWLQIARGTITLNDQTLNQGDGAEICQESALKFQAKEKSEIIIFDLAAKFNS